MKTYKAMVKDSEGNVSEISSDYPTMADFVSDLHANGYTVVSRKVAEVSKYESEAFWADKPEQNSINWDFVNEVLAR